MSVLYKHLSNKCTECVDKEGIIETRLLQIPQGACRENMKFPTSLGRDFKGYYIFRLLQIPPEGL